MVRGLRWLAATRVRLTMARDSVIPLLLQQVPQVPVIGPRVPRGRHVEHVRPHTWRSGMHGRTPPIAVGQCSCSLLSIGRHYAADLAHRESAKTPAASAALISPRSIRLSTNNRFSSFVVNVTPSFMATG